LSALEAQVGDLNRKVASLEQKLAALDAALGRKIAALEQKVAALEEQEAESSREVTAPFTVVDKEGRAIFSVESKWNGLGGTGSVALGVDESGSGFVTVARANASDAVEIGLDEQRWGLRVLDLDGKQVVDLGATLQGTATLVVGREDAGGVSLGVDAVKSGFVTLRQESGKENIALGKRDGQPAMRVLDTSGEKTMAELGVAANGRAALVVGDPASGGVSAAVDASQSGFVNVRQTNGRNSVAVTASREAGQPGVRVFDESGGKPIAELGTTRNGHPALIVGEPEGGGVIVGVGASRAGAIMVRRADGSVGVDIAQAEGRPLGVHVFDSAGARAIAALGTTQSGLPMLVVGEPEGGGVVIGVGASQSGAIVVRRDDGSVAVDIAQTEGFYGVTVAGASGTPLARLGEARNGAGAVSTFDPTGNLRAVMNGLNGEIHVVDASGASRATMVAEGAFSIRSAGGATLVRIGEGTGGGLLQIANSGGNAMVEAGVHPTGAGIVRAYPLGSPGGGMVGMPGTFIMGRPGAQ
jgi:hypothetical protein